jgi:hypothetical protein
MKLLTGAHRMRHNQTSERSLCADVAERNCPHGRCTASERRNWRSPKILGAASLLMQRANPHSSSETACPFGLARKAPT